MSIGENRCAISALGCCCRSSARASSRWRRSRHRRKSRQKHQSLLHFVGKAPWSDAAMLAKVSELVLPVIERSGRAWIIDDTGFPKKGRHSVGVSRQYCGQLGKQDNCQVAVSLSLANHDASLPVPYRLYLPEEWASDRHWRDKAKGPETILFRTKSEIALEHTRCTWAVRLSRARLIYLDPAHLPRDTKGTLQRRAIPAARIGCGRISGGQVFKQQSLGIRGIAYGLVRQNELAQGSVEAGVGRYRSVAEPRLCGIGIGIESSVRKRIIARPEPGATDLVRIGFARDCVGQSGYSTGMARGSRPEKRVTARSKLPQKKCTGLALPKKPVRKSLNTRSACTSARQKRWAAAWSYELWLRSCEKRIGWGTSFGTS
jgi:hypothetical protein